MWGGFLLALRIYYLNLRDDGEGDRVSRECRARVVCEGGNKNNEWERTITSSIYCPDLQCDKGWVDGVSWHS